MKTLILLSLVILVSCGKKGDDSDPYLFEVTTLNREWSTYQFSGQNNRVEFDAIDLSDITNIVFRGVKRDGITSDCVFSGVHRPYNDFYGTFELTYVSGDAFVCSQLTPNLNYNAVNDTKKGFEYMTVNGNYLR